MNATPSRPSTLWRQACLVNPPNSPHAPFSGFHIFEPRDRGFNPWDQQIFSLSWSIMSLARICIAIWLVLVTKFSPAIWLIISVNCLFCLFFVNYLFTLQQFSSRQHQWSLLSINWMLGQQPVGSMVILSSRVNSQAANGANLPRTPFHMLR